MEVRDDKPQFTYPEPQSGSFEIGVLLASVFGSFQLPRPAPTGEGPSDALGDEAERPADHVRDSLLGTPIYLAVRLGDLDLEYATIELSGKKVIGKTPISGGERRGTVKEEFSLGDYRIRIRGILLNNDNQAVYPSQQMRALRQVLEQPGSVDLTNHIAELFNINRIAINDFRFPDLPGSPGAQPYELTGVSDDSLENELLNL